MKAKWKQFWLFIGFLMFGIGLAERIVASPGLANVVIGYSSFVVGAALIAWSLIPNK